MTRILGFFSAACAGWTADRIAAEAATAVTRDRPVTEYFVFIFHYHDVGLVSFALVTSEGVYLVTGSWLSAEPLAWVSSPEITHRKPVVAFIDCHEFQEVGRRCAVGQLIGILPRRDRPPLLYFRAKRYEAPGRARTELAEVLALPELRPTHPTSTCPLRSCKSGTGVPPVSDETEKTGGTPVPLFPLPWRLSCIAPSPLNTNKQRPCRADDTPHADTPTRRYVDTASFLVAAMLRCDLRDLCVRSFLAKHCKICSGKNCWKT